jgi:hypothetical protein
MALKPAEHTFRGIHTMSSYYKQINNVKYDRNVLEMAANLQAGQGDGRISKADAKKLSAAVYDGFAGNSVRTNTEDKTVRRVYDSANFTEAGRDTFEHANRSAGAKIGWATRRSNQAKSGGSAIQSQTASQVQAPIAQQSSAQSPIASQLAVRISQQS